MSNRSSALIGLTVVGAFAIGRFLAPESSAPQAASAPRAAVVAAPSASSRTVVREIVREVDRETPDRAAADGEEPAPEVVAQRDLARSKARTIIGSAVQARRWTKTDAQSLLELLPQLDRDGADEVMNALIAPINAGQMTVETSGSLLDPT
jgi:hypothetical protein